MYVSFIRPQLEYAAEVWAGCTQMDIEKLEKVQLNAAGIVTGLTSFASRNSIYFETGWEPLEHRRNRAKLLTMYKIHNKLVPTYVQNIIQEAAFQVTQLETLLIILFQNLD